MNYSRTIFFILIGISLLEASALKASQGSIKSDMIFDERVKTVMLYREGWNLSHPLIEIGGDQKLIMEFDLLGSGIDNLYYSFIHCNKDWEPSGLFTTDYIDGFHENQIEEYAFSFNTTVSYVHYTLAFPNENVNLSVSGNYVIVVHQPGEPQVPLFTRRFMVVENLTGIKATVRRADMSGFRDTHQQVDVTVALSRLRVTDPRSEIFTAVLQNGRWDNAVTNLAADFVSPTELRYTSLGEGNLFEGGNEFRQFDIRSFRYQTEFVREITYDGRFHNVNLQLSENREFKPYFFRNDFNGKYMIGVQEGVNPSTDADYARVYFTLPAPLKVEGGTIYIAGDMTMWNPLPENYMQYNYEERQYEGSLFLKQGWYNYEYRFLPDLEGSERRTWFEGSHFETENEYLVLVYYRARNSRYDRLVGSFTVRHQAA
ncbi:MAG: DUF5103 domain-containing protein [Bacteroidales bacterium]